LFLAVDDKNKSKILILSVKLSAGQNIKKKPVNAQFKNRTVLPPVPLIGAAHSIYNLQTQLAFLHHPKWSGLKEEFFSHHIIHTNKRLT
jgi:hypothetical protein